MTMLILSGQKITAKSTGNILPASVGVPILFHARDAITPYVFDGDEDLTHTDFAANQSVEFLRQRQSEPLFYISGFCVPHSPLNLPRWFVEIYDPDGGPCLIEIRVKITKMLANNSGGKLRA